MGTNLNSVVEQISEIFLHDSSGHDQWHSMRVYKNALQIAKSVNCDKEILSLVALLHDVDDPKLFHTQNFANARYIMQKANTEMETIEKVVSIIGEISYRGVDTIIPESIEGKIVQDADRLDALGAIGIARTFAYGGTCGKVLYDPDIQPRDCINSINYLQGEGSSINHFYEKLFKLKNMMNTEYARRIAEERDKFMHQYIDLFMTEWEGISNEK